MWRHRVFLRAFRAQLNEGDGAGSSVSMRHRSQLAVPYCHIPIAALVESRETWTGRGLGMDRSGMIILDGA